MKQGSDTEMGGPDGWFHTTRWPEVEDAQLAGPSAQPEAIGKVVGRYWKPVYCYLRHKGYDNEDAKDLTQGFFQKVVLGRGLIQKADESKGRFRNFFLVALERYLKNVHRADTARKRIPADHLVAIDAFDPPSLVEPVEISTPAQAFTYAWASALLDDVIAEVKTRCVEAGQDVHWQLFHARIILPIMEGVDPPSLSELCREYGVSDGKRASNMTITVKRRFEKVIRAHVRRLVASDEEVDDEILELMEIFSAGGAA